MKLEIKLIKLVRIFSLDTVEGPLWTLFMLLIQDSSSYSKSLNHSNLWISRVSNGFLVCSCVCVCVYECVFV